tara:strand:+ start:255 stop:806 length:552 start_codon:yes stop_codon:yes gene_type:complete
MRSRDIVKLPARAKLFSWLTALIQEGQARVDKERRNLIYIEPYASSFFIIGIDEQKEKFFGIPTKLLPWFLEFMWDKIAIDNKNGYIYLYTGQETQDDLIIALKSRRKRLEILKSKTEEDDEPLSINIKAFQWLNSNQELRVSNDTLMQLDLIYTDNPTENINYEEEGEEEYDLTLSKEENIR